jgi:hypothetical protein
VKRFALVLIALTLPITALAEWRYSDDMQQHITTVNADLASAQLAAGHSIGLVGMLQTMTNEADVAGEIFDTHKHVHTLKDEMLAMRVKKATGNGVTLGGAAHSVIALWANENF